MDINYNKINITEYGNVFREVEKILEDYDDIDYYLDSTYWVIKFIDNKSNICELEYNKSYKKIYIKVGEGYDQYKLFKVIEILGSSYFIALVDSTDTGKQANTCILCNVKNVFH